MPCLRIENRLSESCALTTVPYGEWSGAVDGGASDSNGIGFSKGGGSDSESGDNAAIWFDIKVKDQSGGYRDGDGLSHRAERSYGTDPEVKDSDGDGLNDRWEVIYGMDPDDGTTDLTDESDNDGIELIDEYTYGGIPGQKDIFVEVDFMKGEVKNNWPDEDDHVFEHEAQGKVVRTFAKEDIALHIDDGSVSQTKAKYMGGGGQLIFHNKYIDLPGDSGLQDHTPFSSYYQNNNYFANNRHDIFRYALIGHYGYDTQSQDSDFGGAVWPPWSDGMIVSDVNSGGKLEFVILHELGHQLDIPPNPSWVDQYMGSEYKSVMNYDYAYEILDYYTGWFHDPQNNGQWTYVDEWGSLDFYHFVNNNPW